MSESALQGVVAKRSLTEIEYAGVRALADICLSYEDVDLRIGWVIDNSLPSAFSSKGLGVRG